MSVAILRVVSSNPEVSNGFGFFDSLRDGSRVVDSIKLFSRDRSLNCHGRQLNNGRNQKPKLAVLSSMVVKSAGEMAILSEQKVHDVVMKQAALFKMQLRAKDDCDVKPDMVLPGTLSLLSEAYDRCGDVYAEYAKTFYLGISKKCVVFEAWRMAEF